MIFICLDCGTCSMGPANDKKTVVDSKLRYSTILALIASFYFAVSEAF